MTMTPIVCALPPTGNTGWGTAAKRITEELSKIALVSDLRVYSFLNSDYPAHFSAPVLQAVRGVDMLPMYPHLYGDRRVGYSFCEDNILLKRYSLNALRHFERIVCGSNWGRKCMIESGIRPDCVSVAIQGVDVDIFKPAEDRLETESVRQFRIWSSGKFEYRKAQDVVIRAVAVMMERHGDVRLVAAWHNPWPASEATMAQSSLIDWHGSQLDVCCQYLDMGRVELINHPEPHGASVAHINRCDVGLFPNRCEAGTNLPLMEAMSCGLPVIATTSHGHADITRHLERQSILSSVSTPIHRGGMHVADWYEPDLDEVISKLEMWYQEWHNGARLQSDHRMEKYTWAACAQSLLEAFTK